MSRLRTLMQRPLPDEVATATVATLATGSARDARTVARVASVAVASELPADWQRGLARLRVSHAPAEMAEARWNELRRDAFAVAERWGVEAHRLGWNEVQLFGHDPNPIARRLDTAGLVTLLRGRSVIALDAESATILNAGGDCHRFRRMPFPGAACPAIGSVPIWDLAADPSEDF